MKINAPKPQSPFLQKKLKNFFLFELNHPNNNNKSLYHGFFPLTPPAPLAPREEYISRAYSRVVANFGV
jgi:hypothetical protein